MTFSLSLLPPKAGPAMLSFFAIRTFEQFLRAFVAAALVCAVGIVFGCRPTWLVFGFSVAVSTIVPLWRDHFRRGRKP